MSVPRSFDCAEACIDWLLDRIGRDLVVGVPLGIGKPNHLLNALYARAKADAGIRLTLITALTLETPPPGRGLQRRLMQPVIERIFAGYPELEYAADLRRDEVPDNITISEFFFRPGAMLGRGHAQRHYRSVNYTHVARELLDAGVNVLMQEVAPDGGGARFSLSSNPDVSLQLLPEVERRRDTERPIVWLAQANRNMPYMGRDAEVPADTFDAVLYADHELFGPPALPLSAVDYAIGLRVSALLADGGTLQIGIGSLADAIARCTILRHTDNAAYREAVTAAGIESRQFALIEREGGLAPFREGLYGCTEMLVDAYLQLYRAGVLKRRVYDCPVLQRLLEAGRIREEVDADTLRALIEEGAVGRQLTADDVAWLSKWGVFRPGLRLEGGEVRGPGVPGHVGADLSEPSNFDAVARDCLGRRLAGATVLHGGFFLGPRSFYRSLSELPPAERDLFCMTSVGRTNHLYGGEALRRLQRRKARFVNTGLKATVFGAVASDGLDDGQVLSGVGGQYNFVAQAHELPGGRSVLCVRATRDAGGGIESNIVFGYGHVTVPRHLRDIVVTEYGIADLRGKTDAETAAAMIEVADSRFQEELRRRAVEAGKLSADYRVPDTARGNTPDQLRRLLADRSSLFPEFPFGTELTETELTLARALRGLQGLSRREAAVTALRRAGTLWRPPVAARPYLERMGLASPAGVRARLAAAAVTLALAREEIV